MLLNLDPNVWGPHYWFFLHTLAIHYPNHPNESTKKIYHEFIYSLPIFIPVESISKEFITILNTYPILPYLDNRDSFVKWTNFIHNKINEKLEKPAVSLSDFYINYYNQYKTTNSKMAEYFMKQKLFYFAIIAIIFTTIYYLYDK